MENTQNTNIIQEYEEIDLREIFTTFIKKRRAIFGMTIIVAVLALVASLALPKTYNVETILEIGTAPDQNQLNPVEDPVQLAKKIDSDFYGGGVRQKLSLSEREYPKIKVDNFAGNLISMSITSSDISRAKSVLKELDNAVIADYQSRGDQKKAVVLANIDIQKKDINRLKDKVQLTETEKKALATDIASLDNKVDNGKDIALALVLTSEQRSLDAKQQDIESLYLETNQDNQQINTMNGLLDQMKSTSAVQAPAVSQASVSPRILLNTVLGAFLGFFAGIFWAFGVEWWKKNA